jgi:hypothetical protein
MFSVSFTFLSPSEIILGIRLVRNFTVDQEGNPGPNHYQLKIGVIFGSLNFDYARFTKDHL